MEWQDEGIVLTARPHGEADAILTALTFEHGRHLGLVKGGIARRARPLLQPGNRLSLAWKARLAEHLGNYGVEAMQLLGSRLVSAPGPLLGLAAATELVDATAPERLPHPRLYAGLLRLLETMVGGAEWGQAYIRFEVLLLSELGFALHLDACAVTGTSDDLAYVSPRTGRAVSRAAAGDYAPRLLPLPAFLTGGEVAGPQDLRAGLVLTGHFLQRHLLDPADRSLPMARERLLAHLASRSPELEDAQRST